ncbi:MAG: ASCH domain-containing protein [Candidatus Aenigmarchaeota archaeon]|nr:ASCH domain-containing protein [Candidatus Aenigmarchaeota archaeon]
MKEKELWFRPDMKDDLDARKLRATFRAECDPAKGNCYEPGDHVRGRIYDGVAFCDKTYKLVTVSVELKPIREFKPEDFVSSDMKSQTDLMEKFPGYYGRLFDDNETVRRIGIDYR